MKKPRGSGRLTKGGAGPDNSRQGENRAAESKKGTPSADNFSRPIYRLHISTEYSRPQTRLNDSSAMYWGGFGQWTLDEATALSIGRDPREVDWDRIKDQIQINSVARTYADNRKLISNSQGSGELGERISPLRFVEWADRRGIKINKHLVEVVQCLNRKTVAGSAAHPDLMRLQAELKAAASEIELLREKLKAAKSRRISWMKSLLGLARGEFRYGDDTAPYSPINKMVNKILAGGFSLNRDTLRSLLEEATEDEGVQKEMTKTANKVAVTK